MISCFQIARPTREYIKVPNFPGLYRHSRSGRYYGCKKINGKRREVSLRTADRKIAERRLQYWISNLAIIDPEVERTSFRELLAKFVAINRGSAIKTQKTHRAIIRKVERTWPSGLDVEVRHIRPSHINAWLALHESRLRNTTYNAYAALVKRVFEIAVNDRIISRSPFDLVKRKWKKPQRPIRLTPTEDQFRNIVRSIRSQRFTDHSDESADFVEFIGLVGLGQAEAGALTWGDVDFANASISILRRKTDVRFTVWINPEVRELLTRRLRAANNPKPSDTVFSIKDAKKALRAACDRLGYPNFSHRCIRRRFIRKLLRARVNIKVISRAQGHQDGGQLILDTYSEDSGEDDEEYDRSELAKAFN